MIRQESNHNNGSGLLIAALIIGGGIALYFILRKQGSTTSRQLTSGAPTAVHFPWGKEGPSPPTTAGLVRYKNTESREIIWDFEHMVPTKMIITRESLQLP